MFVCSFIIALRIKIRGRYFNITLRTSVDMADGCVDIVLSLERAMNVLFFGTQVLPKK